MKRIFILITGFIVLTGISASSQTLVNTNWYVYDTSAVLRGYFHFGTDTLSYSSDNILYHNGTTFQINGSVIRFHDLPETSVCSLVDTGVYTFVIHNDSLKFTLISDLCTARSWALTVYDHMFANHTGIAPMNQLPANISIYPNPAGDLINVETKNIGPGSDYFIIDLAGRQVLTGKLISGTTTININRLTQGVYFFTAGNLSSKSIKLIKQ